MNPQVVYEVSRKHHSTVFRPVHCNSRRKAHRWMSCSPAHKLEQKKIVERWKGFYILFSFLVVVLQ